MSLDVASLLESLKSEGTIDSEGTFTISLAQARAKMSRFQSASKARFLLFLLSAGTTAGAERFVINHREAKMIVKLPGAYVPESNLLQVFEKGPQASLGAASDLMYGLRDAMDSEVKSALLEVRHPKEDSYSWFLTREIENTKELPHGRAPSVRLTLQLENESIWQRLVSPLRKPRPRPELAVLRKNGCHSQVPLIYNRQSLNEKYELQDWPWLLQVGNGDGVVFPQAPIRPDKPYDWSGGLAFKGGEVTLIVRGVHQGAMISDSFSGIVFHDGLNLDLSREKIVQDSIFGEFLRQLTALKNHCLNHTASALEKWEGEAPWFLPDLFLACLKDELSFASQSVTRQWLLARLPQYASGSQGSWDTGTDLLTVGLSYEEHHREDFSIDDRSLFSYCREVLSQTLSDKAQVVQRAADLAARREPHNLLLRGYLLLGLGALFALTAQQEKGENSWGRALSLSYGSVEEELFKAHLGFAPQHVLQEAIKALNLVLRERPDEG